MLREGIAVQKYTMGSWSVVEVSYNVSLGAVKAWNPPRLKALRPDLVLEKRIIVARSNDTALVMLEYINHADQAVRLEQYSTHIHEGVDGLTVALVPEGFQPGMEDEYWASNVLKLLGRVDLHIDGKSYGSLGFLGLWESLPPGAIAFQREGISMCIRSLDELSSSRLIQVVAAKQYTPAKRPVANSRLELQHGTITLKPGEKARYIVPSRAEQEGLREDKNTRHCTDAMASGET